MAKKKPLYEAVGWTERRKNLIVQSFRVDGTEDLEEREEIIDRAYSCVYVRTSDGNPVFQASIHKMRGLTRDDVWHLYLDHVNHDYSWMNMAVATISEESAKYNADHRVEKWVDQYPDCLDFTSDEEE